MLPPSKAGGGGVTSIEGGGLKRPKVAPSLNHEELQYFFDAFLKGCEVTKLFDQQTHFEVTVAGQESKCLDVAHAHTRTGWRLVQ